MSIQKQFFGYQSLGFLKRVTFMALAMIACSSVASVTFGQGGVEIDAQGVFQSRALIDNSGVLDRQRCLLYTSDAADE